MNNLGKVIIHYRMHIYDNNEFFNYLGGLALYYGCGKLVGSVMGGALLEKFNGLKILYWAEIFNVSSIILMCIQDQWCFVIGRSLCGFYCGISIIITSRIL